VLVSGAAAVMAEWQWKQSGSWSQHEAGIGILAEKQQVVALGSGCEGRRKRFGNWNGWKLLKSRPTW